MYLNNKNTINKQFLEIYWVLELPLNAPSRLFLALPYLAMKTGT